MITRIFRVLVPASQHADFERDFMAISKPLVESSAGLVSFSFGRPTRWSPEEFVLVTVWEGEEALVAFAGEAWNEAVIPPVMEKYITECWVHHYENA